MPACPGQDCSVTARIASRHASTPVDECLRAVAGHAATAGYSSAVYAWAGNGEVELVNAAIPNLLGHNLTERHLMPAGPVTLPTLVMQHLHELPMGFWEYATLNDIDRTASTVLTPLLEDIEQGESIGPTLLDAACRRLGPGVENEAATLSLLNLVVGLLQRRARIPSTRRSR